MLIVVMKVTPEEQLEFLSVSTTLPVGKVGAWCESHQDIEKHHMLSHLPPRTFLRPGTEIFGHRAQRDA